MSGLAVSGDSGGPITDASGALVGIVSGVSDSTCGPSWIVIKPHIGSSSTMRGKSTDAVPLSGDGVGRSCPPLPVCPGCKTPNGGKGCPKCLKPPGTTAKAIAELRAAIVALNERVKVLESQLVAVGPVGPRGLPGESVVGPPGKDGAPGKTGPAGPPGATPTVDIDDLIKRLPPWYLRTVHMGADGETIESVTVEEIPLGEGFSLFLYPHDDKANSVRVSPTE